MKLRFLFTAAFLPFVLFLSGMQIWARPVLMISVDGLRPDLVLKADEYGLRIPNLRRFLAQGTYAEGVTGVLPSSTFPSHTTLITGVWPIEHGIYYNYLFDPLNRNNEGYDNFAEDIRVPTLFDVAHEKGLVTASVSWPVTLAAPGIDFNLPLVGTGANEEATKLRRALARPDGFQQQLEQKLRPDLDGGGATKADEVRTLLAIEILHTKRPDFLAVHLSSVDRESHTHGPFSAEAKRALEEVDLQIGRLWKAILEDDPKSLIVVVSDHGFVRTDYKLNWRVVFADAGLLTLEPTSCDASKPVLKDWQATLWGGGGSAAVMLNGSKDSAVKARVKDVLEKLQTDPHHLVARIIDGEKAREQGGWPDAAFVVELEPGFQFGDAWSGPLITPASSTGTHGYFTDRPEMRSSFFIAGSGIAKGRDLNIIDMRQIAPTIAGLLKVTLPKAKEAKLNVRQ